jgi:hypothetical protein
MQLSIISRPYGARMEVGVFISSLPCGTKRNRPTEGICFSIIELSP